MNACRFPLLIAASALLFCAPVCGQSIDRAVYKVGDTWTYVDAAGPTVSFGGTLEGTLVRTVTKVLPDEIQMETTIVSANGDKRTRTEIASLDFNDFARPNPDVPRQEVRQWIWPVQVGATWKYEVPVRSGTEVWEVHIKGWEEIDVPAGRFKVLKAERVLVSAPIQQSVRMVTVWYSPEAKVNVRRHTHVARGGNVYVNGTRELHSYRVQ